MTDVRKSKVEGLAKSVLTIERLNLNEIIAMVPFSRSRGHQVNPKRQARLKKRIKEIFQ